MKRGWRLAGWNLTVQPEPASQFLCLSHINNPFLCLQGAFQEQPLELILLTGIIGSQRDRDSQLHLITVTAPVKVAVLIVQPYLHTTQPS